MKLAKLKELREYNDFTQTELATKLKISQRVYAYYESGEHIIPIDILIEIADIYNVSLDYLVDRKFDSNVANKG